MTGGVGAALDQAVSEAGDLPDRDQVVQAALFDDLSEADTGALDAASPLSAAIEPRARVGRPRGSRNRRTEAVAAWLLSQHRHPLAVMAEAYSMTPAQLAERIGLRKTADDKDEAGKAIKVWSNETLLEIVKLQLRMAEALAPYVAQKQPQAVQVDAAGTVQIAFQGVNLPARGAAGQGGGPVIEGAMAVRLPFKSDGESRTDG